MCTVDGFLRRGGFALLVTLVGGVGLWKSAGYYGTLLRGFDAQFYYAAGRSAAVSGEWDVTDDLPLSPWQAPFRTEAGCPTRPDGGVKNVFPVGLSLVEAVLLAPALALSNAAGPDDRPAGYTPFQVGWVAAGLLLIAAAGLQVTYHLARTVAAPPAAAAATLAAWIGTPLLYYTAWFPFSAHPTAFTLMTLLLLVADRLPRARRPNAALTVFGTLAALLYLTRPHQSLYIVLLAAWRAPPLLRRGRQAWLPGAALGLAACAAAITFQAAVHRLNTGSPALLAHGRYDHPMISGHFDPARPQFGYVLFSKARGLFWVTPVVVLALAGYAARRRAVPWWGWAALVNAAVQTILLAFWSEPGLGDSFGLRLWAEHVPAVACGLGLLVSHPARRKIRVAAWAAIIACAGWTTLLCADRIFRPAGSADSFMKSDAVAGSPVAIIEAHMNAGVPHISDGRRFVRTGKPHALAGA